MLKDAHLRWGQGLPLLWAYMWGVHTPSPSTASPSDKGKARETDTSPGRLKERDKGELYSGKLEESAPPSVLLTLRVLLALTANRTNLLLIRAYLPHLPEFLLTRIYGWEPQREFDITFPPRDEWYQNAHAESSTPPRDWTVPTDTWRAMYLALLQRVVTGGVNPQVAWRLFELVRKVPPKEPKMLEGIDSMVSSGVATPTEQPSSPGASGITVAAGSGNDTPRSQKKKPTLKIKVKTPRVETLDTEVLDLVRRAMRSHNPQAFVFRSAPHVEDGGLEIPELGRPFPNNGKGFVFATWVNISQLTDGITLLHLSQAGRKHPLLQVRILENSQIGILTTAWKDKEEEEAEPNEVVCGAVDALIPHNEWVHFAIGCRKGRSVNGGGGEARVFINGRRVGAIRVTYPVPKPPPRDSKNGEGVRVSIGRPWPADKPSDDAHSTLGHGEANEWALGRSLFLEEVVAEDLILLMHHLGPRYSGNMQEALGKFLTYEDATSINIHLHGLATAAQQKALALLPANSQLVRAISTGPAIAEDNIMFSLCASDVLESLPGEDDFVLNGAVPHASRARDFKYGRAKLVGNIFPYAANDLDVTISSVGGGIVALKLVDLAKDSAELNITLGVLWDMLKYSWAASEEMERIRK